MEQAKSPQDETGSCLPNFFEVPPTRNKALGTTATLQQKKLFSHYSWVGYVVHPEGLNFVFQL